jgi:hypothetical protein
MARTVVAGAVAAAATVVSHSCACIGSRCLRQCVHGASIGGEEAAAAAAAASGWEAVGLGPELPCWLSGGGVEGFQPHSALQVRRGSVP